MRYVQRVQWIAASLLLVALVVSPAQAARNSEIQIDHADGQVRQIDSGVLKTPAGISLASKPTFFVRKGNEVVVTIINPNPLLFVYSMKKGTPTKTDNQINAEKFADLALGPLAEALEAGGSAGRDSAPICNPAVIPGIQEFKAATAEITRVLGKKDGILLNSLVDLPKATTDIRTWKLKDASDNLAQAEKDLAKAQGDIAKGDAQNLESCEGRINTILGEIPRVRKVLEELKEFEGLFKQIGAPIRLEPFVVNIAENQPIEIKITKSKFFPQGLETNRFLGDGVVVVSPEDRARLVNIAPAMVYSFVRDPAFEAKASGNQFVIEKKENPYKELDLAAMLLIEPDAWDLGSVSFGLQLGASPQKDPGLFLGLSLRANDLFKFGAGVAFQRVNRLKEGLSVGQTIASQDLLKTEKEFKEGLYLHITVTPRTRS